MVREVQHYFLFNSLYFHNKVFKFFASILMVDS